MSEEDVEVYFSAISDKRIYGIYHIPLSTFDDEIVLLDNARPVSHSVSTIKRWIRSQYLNEELVNRYYVVLHDISVFF